VPPLVKNFLTFVHGPKDYNSVDNMQAIPQNMTIPKENDSFYYSLSNFTCESIIGVYARERTIRQTLIFDINIEFSDNNFGRKKNLDLLVKNHITESVKNLRAKLLENLAYNIGKTINDNIPYISQLTITIKKPSAIKNARCSYVRLFCAHQ
jgi:dihydroneopterin aldolase